MLRRYRYLISLAFLVFSLIALGSPVLSQAPRAIGRRLDSPIEP